MAENNLDKALAYLGTSLQTLVTQANGPVDLEHLHTKIAKRSLTGDHLNGGTIINFASTGIKDESTKQQITIRDSAVEITNLTVGQLKGDLSVENAITAKTISVDVLEVRELKTDLKLGQSAPLEITVGAGETLTGKGMLLKGQGPTKQLIFTAGPDKFLSTEHFELLKDHEYRIDGSSVLSATALGIGVVKSNLRELGRLRGLIVDGSMSLGQYVYYNDTTNRFGIGIENPNAGLSVCEDGVEVMIGTKDQTRGVVGTFAAAGLDLVTDNTSRINIGASGNILLGNITEGPVQVSVHGKLAVRVNVPDPDVDLHVNGPVRFHGHLHIYADSAPDSGTYKPGDIVWNTAPKTGGHVGWVCTRAGSPGDWNPFGPITQAG
jgi:hypothetical protein